MKLGRIFNQKKILRFFTYKFRYIFANTYKYFLIAWGDYFQRYSLNDKILSSQINELSDSYNNFKENNIEIINNIPSDQLIFIKNLAKKLQLSSLKNNNLTFNHGIILTDCLNNYLCNMKIQDEKITILETGTAKGFSSLCMAFSLDRIGKNGTIITSDLIANRIPIFWDLPSDKFGKKSRLKLLEKYDYLISKYIIYLQGFTSLNLSFIDIPRINIAFLDGEHNSKALKSEFNYVALRQKKDDIIIMDDYNPTSYADLSKNMEILCKIHNYKFKIREVNLKQSRYFLIATKIQ